MTYIIENANILKGKQLTNTSLLIDNGFISAIKPNFNRYTYLRMNTESFIMTPTPILLKRTFPLDKPFSDLKNIFIEEFILKGCTAFLTTTHIHHEQELIKELKRLKTKLLNSPIDYIIGVTTSVQNLTPNFLRLCKREKIPAIFVQIDHEDKLYDLPWGWLREAMFPYNSPLIPLFRGKNERENKLSKLLWTKLMEIEKLPFIADELPEAMPLSYSVLAKIGIYPFKGNIQQGHELSYNLYEREDENRNIEEIELFHYHKSKLVVTVHKGDVIRANEYIMFRPGFGEYVKIKTPSYLKIEA